MIPRFILPLLTLLLLAGGCATQDKDTASAGKEFVGTWTMTDGDGELFNAVIQPDGTAITNWSKGASGAKGEFGRWSAEPGKISITYDDGWQDQIVRRRGGYHHTAFAPGVDRNGKPSNQGAASRVKGKVLSFVGVWETVAVENDAPFFMALKSDGTAAKNIDSKSKGRWKVTDGAALITWDDGWVDRISQDGASWVNEAWQPGKNKHPGAPTGRSKTWMVGTD